MDSTNDRDGGSVATNGIRLRRVVAGALVGTALEWYDFFLYGTAAALVFNKLFFSDADPATGTLLAFATFGVGFLVRPLGGVLFGHLGDKIGRRETLVITTLVMGLATGLIGLLPAYAAIGLWAPVIVLIVLQPVYGALSDRIGRKPVNVFSVLFTAAFAYPISCCSTPASRCWSGWAWWWRPPSAWRP
jgi:MFS family permease